MTLSQAQGEGTCRCTSTAVNPSQKQTIPTLVKQMWAGGPFRYFTERPTNHSHIAYHGTALRGFVGAYFCPRCFRFVAGVFRVAGQWLCFRCKGSVASRNGMREGCTLGMAGESTGHEPEHRPECERPASLPCGEAAKR